MTTKCTAAGPEVVWLMTMFDDMAGLAAATPARENCRTRED